MSNNHAGPSNSAPNDSATTGKRSTDTAHQSRLNFGLQSSRAVDFTPPDRILPYSPSSLSPLPRTLRSTEVLIEANFDSNAAPTRPRFSFSRRISDQSRLRTSSTPSLLSKSRPPSASPSSISLQSSPPSRRRSGDEAGSDLWVDSRVDWRETGRVTLERVITPAGSISSRRNSLNGDNHDPPRSTSRPRAYSAPSLPSTSHNPSLCTLSNAPTESLPSFFPDVASKSLALFLDSPTPSSSPSPAPFRSINHFDRIPRELHVKILGALITVCEEDLDREIRAGTWKGQLSSRRWVGRVRGFRELISAGRTSKEWRELTLDGQIWSTVPTSVLGADLIDWRMLLSIAGSAGRFIRVLDLQGMANLTGEQLMTIVDCCCAGGTTSFVDVNLIGCRELDSQSMIRLFSRSPGIEIVRLSGLDSVQTTVVAALAQTATRLRILDVNRCTKLPAFVLLDLPATLTTLRISRILGLTSIALVQIFHRFPNLANIDISYCPLLDDSAFANLVGCEVNYPGHTILLPSNVRKRVYRNLRSLVLDGSMGITDQALESLAHTVPMLETLSLARIGAGLHAGAGLAKLLATTPLIRRLDLEDASALTDAVLSALTPSPTSPRSILEHLSINRCTTLTDPAILSLVTSSTHLRILEADSTSITESTAKAIIKTFRERGFDNSMLSILDTRLMRRVGKEVAHEIRPRQGRRGYFARHFRYFDPPSTSQTNTGDLFECDSSRVVVRSFFGSTSVDTAVAMREQTAEGRRRRSLMRFSEDSRGGVEDSRASCIIS